jgi:protein-S-isoprenylcysteine O-methyltransferase Ste14
MVFALRNLLSILLLPTVVAGVVPYAIMGGIAGLSRPNGAIGWLAVAGGGVAIVAGLVLVVATVRMFASIGRGTLAPWDPPRRLVVSGVYRYVRNPMISGVLIVLVGEGLALRAADVLAWAAVFFAINATYIPLLEEPGLARRFGDAYDEYARHVPRWIPRRTPWPRETEER